MSIRNGTHGPDTLTELRETRRSARLLAARMQLRRLESTEKRQARLLESQEGWEWIGGYSEVLDRLRGPERDFTLPVSVASDRRYGANWPFWRTWLEHSRLRASARLLHGLSTLAQGALRGLTNYVVGRGHAFRATVKKGVTPKVEVKALIAAVQAAIDEFEQANSYGPLQRELFLRSRRDGEYLLRDFPQADGMLLVRTVDATQLVEPVGCDPETQQFGVFNERQDLEAVTGYNVAYDGDPLHAEKVDKDELQHVKINVDRTVKRGLTDLCFDTYDTIKSGQRLIENLAEGSAVQAAIALVRQHDQSTQSEVQGFVTANTDYNDPSSFTQDGSGSGGPNSSNVTRYYPGKIEDIPKGMNYVAPPFAANAQGFAAVVQVVLRSVAVKWNAPEWLTSGDASNNNYSSSITAESPWVKSCHVEQEFYGTEFKRPIWHAIKARCEARALRANGRAYSYEEVRRLVDVQGEPPTVEVRDKSSEASTNVQYAQANIKSPQTISQELGLDYEQEQQNIEEHNERTGGLGGDLPDQLPDDDGADLLGDSDGDDPGGGLGGDAGGGGDDSANQLRATVGGSTAIAALQKSYYAGELPREAAIANASIVFGFDPSQAEQLFPAIAPVKLAPDDQPAGPTLPSGPGGSGEPPPTMESILARLASLRDLIESCVPNKAGTGHHDDHTGAPCSTGGGEPAGAGGHPASAAGDGGGHPTGGSLGGIVAAVAKTFRAAAHGAGHIEHVAKEFLATGVDKQIARLPATIGKAVAASWWTTKLGTKAAFVTYTAGQAAAEAVAREVGATPEQAARLRGICTAIDLAGAKAVPLTLAAVGLGAAAAPASFLPAGSTAYLAYSTVRHPVAVLRAAKKAVAGVLSKVSKRTSAEGATDDLAELMDRLQQDDSGWYDALVCVALDKSKSLGEAVAVADDAAKDSQPQDLGEACVPNAIGKKHHDSRTGAPCNPGAVDVHRAAARVHGQAQKSHAAASKSLARASATALGHQKKVAAAAEKLAVVKKAAKGKPAAAKKVAAAKAALDKAKAKHGDAKKAHRTAASILSKHAKMLGTAKSKLDAAKSKLDTGEAPAKPTVRPAPKKAAPAKGPPTSAPATDHPARLLGALEKLASAVQKLAKGPDDLVSLADLKDATGLSVPELHAVVQQMRKDGVLTGSNAEGRHGLSKREQEALLKSGDDRIGFVSVRDPEALKKLAGPGEAAPAVPATRTVDRKRLKEIGNHYGPSTPGIDGAFSARLGHVADTVANGGKVDPILWTQTARFYQQAHDAGPKENYHWAGSEKNLQAAEDALRAAFDGMPKEDQATVRASFAKIGQGLGALSDHVGVQSKVK